MSYFRKIADHILKISPEERTKRNKEKAEYWHAFNLEQKEYKNAYSLMREFERALRQVGGLTSSGDLSKDKDGRYNFSFIIASCETSEASMLMSAPDYKGLVIKPRTACYFDVF